MLVSSELVVDFDVLNYVGHTAFHIKRNVHIFSFYDEPHHNQKYHQGVLFLLLETRSGENQPYSALELLSFGRWLASVDCVDADLRQVPRTEGHG